MPKAVLFALTSSKRDNMMGRTLSDGDDLLIGEKLGHYQVLEKIGQGGMGEVYLAEDTKLERRVALKMLPAEVAEDRERLERFRREAKVLATLNHPNIGAIYGLEEEEGRLFLALELVDGEDLADVLAQGPLPADEAASMALEIVAALAAAHERGIVHRDLKPANIKRASDGRIKVLDFGLAKAVVAADPGADLSSSPTAALSQTAPGMVMGTARYMSPEQARARPVDARSDIWAFGVVLFEMLTGRPAFDGDTFSDILASVLKDNPDWSQLPADVPPSLRELLELCLERDPGERLADISDARIWLRRSEAPAETRPSSVSVRPLVVGAALALAGVSVLLWRLVSPMELPGGGVERYMVSTLGLDPGFYPTNPVLSDDGTRLVVVALDPGDQERRLFQRRIDELELAPIAGTENAGWASFSPDGNQILFYDASAGTLNRISVHGGARMVLADPSYLPAHWGDDGYVYFPRRGDQAGLYRVPEDGGDVERLTPEPAGGGAAVEYLGAQLLPDGGAVLLAVGKDRANTGWDIAFVDLTTGSLTTIVEDGIQPSYVGHYVFFTRDHRLWAVPFDADARELLDDPRPVLDNVQLHPTAPVDVAQASVSARGSLVYVRGDVSVRRESALIAVGRDGSREVVLEESGMQLYSPSITGDGRRLSFVRYDGSARHALTRDLRTRALSRAGCVAPPRNIPICRRRRALPAHEMASRFRPRTTDTGD